MEEISRLIRAEIRSLQDHITRAEDHFLATAWTAELLRPLLRIEGRLSPAELAPILSTLSQLCERFALDDPLKAQLAALLDRHLQVPAAPLAGPSAEPHAVFSSDVPTEQPAALSTHGLFEEEDEEVGEPAAPPAPVAEEFEPLSFAAVAPASLPARKPAPVSAESPSPARLSSPHVDIFAVQLRWEDVQAKLGISLLKQDAIELEVKLHHKLASRTVSALKSHAAAAGQYTLIPRPARFIYRGTLQPCTDQNLAKLYSPLFGKLHDLTPYQDSPFLHNQTPELDWALVVREAPPESLGKNYIEQSQLLIHLASVLGLPAQALRRRSLVEALYDLLVAYLVLGQKWQKSTLDWTASSPTRNHFICAHFATEGIRFRDFPRTFHHRALGVCLNW